MSAAIRYFAIGIKDGLMGWHITLSNYHSFKFVPSKFSVFLTQKNEDWEKTEEKKHKIII